jgi:hypothetical protein
MLFKLFAYTCCASAAFLGCFCVTFFASPDGDGLLDRLHLVLLYKLPLLLRSILQFCVGERGPKAVDDLYAYLWKTRNPLLQIFYTALMVGGFSLWWIFGAPYIPNIYLSNIHLIVVSVVYLMCMLTFYLASVTDPGIITSANVQACTETFDYDEVVFHRKTCETCKTVKPARSKHCSLCDVCVSRFDHHCIWINNCVGHNNIRYFLLYLVSNTVFLLYGSVILTLTLAAIVVEGKLQEATFIDVKTRVKHQATWSMIVQYLMSKYTIISFLDILTLVMGTLVLWFTGSTLYYQVLKNCTTNEMYKYRFAAWDLKRAGKDPSIVANIYNHGWRKNWREIWDKPWYLHSARGRSGVTNQHLSSPRRNHEGMLSSNDPSSSRRVASSVSGSKESSSSSRRRVNDATKCFESQERSGEHVSASEVVSKAQKATGKDMSK